MTLRLSAESGGTTQAICGLARSLSDQGLKVDLVTTAADDKRHSSYDTSLEVQTFRQGWLRNLWTGYARGISEFLASEVPKYDLVHVHELWHHPHFAACRAAQRAARPYIVTLHGGLTPWAMNHKVWKKRIYWMSIQRNLLKGAAALHAITDDEVTYARRLGLENHLALIPNGIDTAEFRDLPPKGRLSQLYPELAGKKVILFLGRLHPIKGLDLLASAFGDLAQQREDVRLVIAGPDNDGYRSQLESMLNANGAVGKTTFTGMLLGERKLAALCGSDILVLPSYSEVRGLVTLEGMVCGLPVVITRQCCFPEVAESGAGLEVDPDPDQLREALETLLNDADLRRRMGQKGRELVLSNFTWDRVASQAVGLYNQVLDRQRKGG